MVDAESAPPFFTPTTRTIQNEARNVATWAQRISMNMISLHGHQLAFSALKADHKFLNSFVRAPVDHDQDLAIFEYVGLLYLRRGKVQRKCRGLRCPASSFARRSALGVDLSSRRPARTSRS